MREVIIKYRNRKLYSTKENRYVTLKYILDLVRLNQKFIVLSKETGEDITNSTLVTSLRGVAIGTKELTQLIKGN